MTEILMRSVFEQDKCPVVLCDREHKIVYMNPAAIKRYESRGGEKLVGKSLLDCHNEKSCEMINRIINWFSADKANNMIFTSRNDIENKDVYMVALRDDTGELIGYYEKHEYRTPECSQLYDFTRSLL